MASQQQPEQQYELWFKILLVGAVAGKTNLMVRMIDDHFQGSNKHTMGADVGLRLLEFHGKQIYLQLWDTGANASYSSLKRIYFKHARGAFLVYDVTDRSTFRGILETLQAIRAFADPKCCVALIGNKCDLEHRREVSFEEGQRFAMENGLVFFETSAKTGENVEKAFQELTARVVHRLETEDPPAATLHDACRQDTTFNRFNAVSRLLHLGQDPNRRDSQERLPLHIASESDASDVVQLLLKHSADINAKDKEGWTALHYAAFNDRADVVRILLEQGADTTIKHRFLFGKTALDLAVSRGHSDVIKLLRNPQAVQARPPSSPQPASLHDACKHGDTARVSALIDKGNVDVSEQDTQSDTPLHVACRHNHAAVVQLLLQKGANITTKNNKGQTPLDVAKASGHKAITSMTALQPTTATTPSSDSDQQPPEDRDEKGDEEDPATGELDDETQARLQQEKAKEAYVANVRRIMQEIAERCDQQMAGRAKLNLVGQGRAGKTTTLRSLRGLGFNKDEHSTKGAATHDMNVTVDSMDVYQWKAVTGFLSEVARSLRDTALAQAGGMDAVMRMKMEEAHRLREERVALQLVSETEADAPVAAKGDVHGDEAGLDASGEQVLASGNELGAHVVDDDDDDDDDDYDDDSDGGGTETADAAEPTSASLPSPPALAASSAVMTAGMGTVPNISTEEIENAIKDLNLDTTFGEGNARVTFKVFDLGGQSTFYIFHPFFLTKYAVYLLVFSMEDLLHQDESKRAETWEFMEHWLSSLHLHAKGAPVLIVGTFADVVSKRKQHENISRDIYSRLRHNPAFPGVIHNDKHGLWFWPVDNTKSIRDPMIQDLRQTISSTALAQEYVSQEVAVPYLHLYDKLHAIARDEKRPLLTFDDVVDIARTCGLRTRQETKACLQFLHLYSMVLYYDHVPGMENYVILSPQWAVDTMTRVIRNFDLHRDERDWEARAVGAQLWDDLVDRGILHRRLLEVLWKDVRDDLIEPFLQLMMEYGLCMDYTPPRSAESSDSSSDNSVHHDDEQQREHQQYLVPAILPMVLDTPSDLPSSVTLSVCAAQHVHKYAGHEPNTAYISFRLTPRASDAHVSAEDMQRTSFFPEGLFAVVLAHVLRYIQPSTSSTPMLSRTHVVVFVGEAEVELQLVPAVGGIKIKIAQARPRALLHMLCDIIVEAIRQRYHDLKPYVLLPHDDKTLLFFEDVRRHHNNKRALRVGRSQLLSPDDLIAKYGPLLPVLGLQENYDVFISYRQRGNRGLVLTLHPKLEHHGLVAFVDVNNLETGVNFKHACLTALQHSVVACPVLSVAAIHQMRSLGDTDTCDNVLLEWMAMLELQQLAHKHPDKIRLRRIVPLFLGSGWHDSNHTMSVASASEYDSPEYMKRLAESLPDVVSEKTAASLDQFFTQVLHLPPPQQHKTVRETVLSLFDIDGVMSFQRRVDRGADAARFAEQVRQVVSAGSSSRGVQRPTQTSQEATSSLPPSTQPAPADVSTLSADLREWLQSADLLAKVGPALIGVGVEKMDDLGRAMRLMGDDFKAEMKAAGAKPFHVACLLEAFEAEQ
ncbi:GTPase [Salpingoeca rosetta]|uniref:non-specific serine/threonine protein kinase n=1 Tax=Salpingoeca rosetta (strain ATCC 50818 / BSB-021) TaxID=946362 RepID=F2U898_SALR5|nr:GTPase [Salpingoeca rosetta]EGD72606.1 GTPase [Salpingoeca rosetta]|eukprot:XP_004994429.1 GTPase [Salpingoeca rosetta]